MGSFCEFTKPSKDNHLSIFDNILRTFAPGEVTDDREMAISAAFAYIDSINEPPSRLQDIIYYYFCIWRFSHPKDIGNATSTALRFWNKEKTSEETKFDYKGVKASNWDSLANGFLMRISTFITYYYYTHLENIYNIIQNFFKNEINDITKEIISLYLDIYKESSKILK
jgi:ADP-ribosylglycohydrolase